MIKKLTFKLPGTLMLSILLFISIFLLLFMRIPYTLMSWESNDLYLNTSDYLKELNTEAHPTWQLLLNFCCQFFYYKYAGPAIIALGITLPYTIVSHFFRHKIVKMALASLVFISVACYSLQDKVTETEHWNHLEYAAEHHLWNEVLDIATPEKCREDRQMIPYALLAMAVHNELADKMFQYPIRSVEDFDTQGETNQRYFFFKMVLYDCLGCPNEAIHNNFQVGSQQPYGTSFGVLRRLVRFNTDAGNLTMVNKYKKILSHSTLHATWDVEQIPYADTLKLNNSGKEPLVTKSLSYNLGTMLNMGINTPELQNYFLCQLLASRNLLAFISVLEKVTIDKSTPLPTHFQEALLVYATENPTFNLKPFNISVNIQSSYQQFLKSGATSGNQYWDFYQQKFQ